MEYHMTMEDFRGRFGTLSRSRFVAQFSSPFLVIEMRGRKKSDGLSAFAKTSNSKLPTLPAVRLDANVVDTLVASLEKSDRNQFENMVTIGRDNTNDIVLTHMSVSKFHAVVRHDADKDGFSIWDVGSMNGTSVNGTLLGEGDSALLESGETIVFGKSVQATYFPAAEFYDYIRLINRLRESREGSP